MSLSAADLFRAVEKLGLPCGSAPGVVAANDGSHLMQIESTLAALGAELAKVHRTALDDGLGAVATAPFRLVELAQLAFDRLEGDSIGLSEAYSHVDAHTVLQTLEERCELVTRRGDPVVLLQGNPVLSNLMMQGPQVCGFADWTNVRAGDRHWDLALACRDLVQLVGPNSIAVFVHAYGEDLVDPIRLDWYSMAVELLG